MAAINVASLAALEPKATTATAAAAVDIAAPDNYNPNLNGPQLGLCPGCAITSDYANVPMIKSARQFFRSGLARNQNRNLVTTPSDGYPVQIPSSVVGWRTQAKLAAGPLPGNKWSSSSAGCTFGLFQRGSHTVISCPECAVHHPSINRAVKYLTRATATAQTQPYDESTGTGDLRYVQLQVERYTNRICLTLVYNAEKIQECQAGFARLYKELRRLDAEGSAEHSGGKRLFHSFWLHYNDGDTNTIFARGNDRWQLIDGPEYVREALPTLQRNDNESSNKHGLLFFLPSTFRQGNMDGFDEIALEVARAIPSSVYDNPTKVCELYAGVGTLGLTALSYAHHHSNGNSNNGLSWLRCSDENPNNPKCFEKALQSMPFEVVKRTALDDDQNKQQQQGTYDDEDDFLTEQLLDQFLNEDDDDDYNKPRRYPERKHKKKNNDIRKVTYKVASASQALKEGEAMGANVLIVDPPRKGLEEEVLHQLCQPINSRQKKTDNIEVLRDEDGYYDDEDDYDNANQNINLTNDVTTLIYVSCGFDALARDTTQLLSSNGGWELIRSTGYVLFPGSNHVETLAIFQRVDPRERGKRRQEKY